MGYLGHLGQVGHLRQVELPKAFLFTCVFLDKHSIE